LSAEGADAARIRDAAEAAFPAAEPGAVAPCPHRHWIEIELLDEDGVPQGGVAFEILDAGGAMIASGTLDAEGRARVAELEWNAVSVSFPRIDARVWRAA